MNMEGSRFADRSQSAQMAFNGHMLLIAWCERNCVSTGRKSSSSCRPLQAYDGMTRDLELVRWNAKYRT